MLRSYNGTFLALFVRTVAFPEQRNIRLENQGILFS